MLELEEPLNLRRDFENYVHERFIVTKTTSKVLTRERRDAVLRYLNDPDMEVTPKFRYWTKQKCFRLIDGVLYMLPNTENDKSKKIKDSDLRQVICAEDFFPVLLNNHLMPNGHKGSKKMLKELSALYASIPRSVVEKFIELCCVCQNKNLKPTMARTSNMGNDYFANSRSVPQFHCTFLKRDEQVVLDWCKTESCNCRMIHCPFCSVDHFRPYKRPAKVQDHVQNMHVKRCVFYDDTIIVKCFLKCRDAKKKEGHYHCMFCPALMPKRYLFLRHLRFHNKKMKKDARSVLLPKKDPTTILFQDHKIEVCDDSCEDLTTKHYHCPMCLVTLEQSSDVSVLGHLWRCWEKSHYIDKSGQVLAKDTTKLKQEAARRSERRAKKKVKPEKLNVTEVFQSVTAVVSNKFAQALTSSLGEIESHLNELSQVTGAQWAGSSTDVEDKVYAITGNLNAVNHIQLMLYKKLYGDEDITKDAVSTNNVGSVVDNLCSEFLGQKKSTDHTYPIFNNNTDATTVSKCDNVRKRPATAEAEMTNAKTMRSDFHLAHHKTTPEKCKNTPGVMVPTDTSTRMNKEKNNTVEYETLNLVSVSDLAKMFNQGQGEQMYVLMKGKPGSQVMNSSKIDESKTKDDEQEEKDGNASSCDEDDIDCKDQKADTSIDVYSETLHMPLVVFAPNLDVHGHAPKVQPIQSSPKVTPQELVAKEQLVAMENEYIPSVSNQLQDVLRGAKGCPLCSFYSYSFAETTEHIKVFHQIETLRCDVCEQIFDSRANLSYHLNYKHGPMPYNAFQSLDPLTGPMPASMPMPTPVTYDSNSPELFVCSQCNGSFPTYDEAQYHITVCKPHDMMHRSGLNLFPT